MGFIWTRVITMFNRLLNLQSHGKPPGPPGQVAGARMPGEVKGRVEMTPLGLEADDPF